MESFFPFAERSPYKWVGAVSNSVWLAGLGANSFFTVHFLFVEKSVSTKDNCPGLLNKKWSLSYFKSLELYSQIHSYSLT